MRRLTVLILGVCALLALTVEAGIAAPANPTGKVVLTVTGAISEKNSDKGLEMDMAMLEKIGLQLCEVRDPWLGSKKYTGVLVSAILETAGASEDYDEVIVIAKDGKKVTLTADDINKYPIILATQDGGKAIGTGVGGPIKLVFPYGTHPEVEKVHDKNDWNWYVITLEVKVK
ncbi:MAG: hypothetical protein NUW23_03355 [Firmicutes bacterium]|jgi:hypothetical protein|nr:hypothetical protein [Bacillota bacterium]